MRAAVDVFWQDYLACLDQTPACDVGTLPETHTGRALEVRTEIVNGYNVDGVSFRNLDEYRISVLSVTLDDGLTTAVVRICVDDASVKYRAGGNPDGSDLIMSDDRISSLIDWEMVKGDDGHWRQEYGDTIDRTVNAEPVCDING